MNKLKWILLVTVLAGLAGAGVSLAAARGQAVEARPPHPLLSDAHIRQALAYCSDRAGLVQSVYSFLDPAQQQALLMDTFLPKTHWAYHAPDPAYTYPFSPTLGVQLLEQAGWTLSPGAEYRTNAAGYELALGLTTTTAAFRQTWATALQNQLRQNCGIRLFTNHISAGVWFGDDSGLARREFELAGFAWVGQLDPGGETLYACDQIPTAENGWVGQNYMGWCNPAASQAIERANNTFDRQEKIAQYAIVQDEFARDMPSLPLFQRVLLFAADANLQGLYPTRSSFPPGMCIAGRSPLKIPSASVRPRNRPRSSPLKITRWRPNSWGRWFTGGGIPPWVTITSRACTRRCPPSKMAAPTPRPWR